RPRWPLWSIPLYLLAADLVNTALSATLTFSDHVLYPTYAHVPRLFAGTALSDQAAAGVIMWVPGSLVFMIPAVVLAVPFLLPAASLVRPGKARGICALSVKAPSSVSPPRGPFDLLTVPIAGHFLRSLLARRTMQIGMLVLAIAVIVDGVRGPQSSSV